MGCTSVISWGSGESFKSGVLFFHLIDVVAVHQRLHDVGSFVPGKLYHDYQLKILKISYLAEKIMMLASHWPIFHFFISLLFILLLVREWVKVKVVLALHWVASPCLCFL